MSELKNCPFCGGEARFKWSFGTLLAECTSCFVSKGDSGGDGEAEIKASAAAAWNRRTLSEAPDAKDGERFRAIADGTVILSILSTRPGNWGARHKDANGFDSRSWHAAETLAEAIDSALSGEESRDG